MKKGVTLLEALISLTCTTLLASLTGYLILQANQTMRTSMASFRGKLDAAVALFCMVEDIKSGPLTKKDEQGFTVQGREWSCKNRIVKRRYNGATSIFLEKGSLACIYKDKSITLMVGKDDLTLKVMVGHE